jgi:hypothetical protein
MLPFTVTGSRSSIVDVLAMEREAKCYLVAPSNRQQHGNIAGFAVEISPLQVFRKMKTWY